MTPLVIALALSLLLVGPSPAKTYSVNPSGTGDFPDIQSAIDAAQDDDVIELANGWFRGSANRSLNVRNKVITIRSQRGDREFCVINCENDGRGFWFQEGTTGSVLEGITVRNAARAAILCTDGSPIIRNCAFINNHSDNIGGGFYAYYGGAQVFDCLFEANDSRQGAGAYCGHATVRFERCTFRGNTAEESGGAVGMDNSTVVLEDCLVTENVSALGGGLDVHSSTAQVSGTLFYGNDAPAGGGVHVFVQGDISLDRCIIAGSIGGSAVHCEGTGEAFVSCSDITGNQGGDWVGCLVDQLGESGNFSADPLFCDSNAGDFTLEVDSPCLPGNHPGGWNCGQIGPYDVGCSTVPTLLRTWAGVKSHFH